MTKIYMLAVNGTPVCEVTSQAQAWLPVGVRLSRPWLKGLVERALREHLDRRWLSSSNALALN